MFPHDKLDWTISRLRERRDAEGSTALRLALARACLSRSWFHGGKDDDLQAALNEARRVLREEPGLPDALVCASLALVLMDRPEVARRYLLDAESAGQTAALWHLTHGELHRRTGEAHRASADFAEAARLSADSWEPHLLLARVLLSALPEDAPRREVERVQFHLVRALSLGAAPEVTPDLLLALARLCLRSDNIADAQRLLDQLLNHPTQAIEARYLLGCVAARSGRHKKAILYFHQYLQEAKTESAEVWTRIGRAYLNLSEAQGAREACQRALAIAPGDVEARWLLGSALVIEGHPEDAVRTLRELLELAPDHTQAFAELVRMRVNEADLRWLRQALRSETAVYDRLPPVAWRFEPRSGREVPIDPRAATRKRIDALLRALGRIDPDVSLTVLSCLDLTTDEGLRFKLWDGVLDLLATARAASVSEELLKPGEAFSAELGRDVLTLASRLDETRLAQGLDVVDEDLRAAAVQRHPASNDVATLRRHIAHERQEARAWQALLLLALASHGTASARNLLVRWAADADPELSLAAQAGLALCGDADAVANTRKVALGRQLDHLVTWARARDERPTGVIPARLLTDRDDLVCATCGRRGGQVQHMAVGREGPNGHVAICNVCTTAITERQTDLRSRDPSLACALTGATLLDTKAIYVYQGIAVSADVVDLSVGHDEREAVASFLSAI